MPQRVLSGHNQRCLMERVGEENEGIVQRKKAMRREVLTIRDSINSEDKVKYDVRIREIITQMTEYREAEVILAYVSYRSEVDTILLIKQALADGKVVFAPKVTGCEIEFWKIMSPEDLREGYRGIPEPKESISFPDWIMDDDNTEKVCKAMMWMPGAVFDKERHRIGYGGGFYDRYLNRLAENAYGAMRTRNHTRPVHLVTAALAYSCQVLDRIPHEAHDRKPDLIITEQGNIIRNRSDL